MRVDSLWIGQWKNLNNFALDFDETTLATVVVGRNGTGKSNLLEALVVIFRDLDLEKPKPEFAFKIGYLCRGFRVEIDADPSRAKEPYIFRVDGEVMAKGKFLAREEQGSSRYLPRHVFGYYSGNSSRMEELFEAHQDRFYKQLIGSSNDKDKDEEKDKDKFLRPFFYARLVHSQFALLGFFSKNDEKLLAFLKQHLRITRLDSILFVLHEPTWTSKSGDERFWKARGPVAQLLSHLYDSALAPMKLERRVKTGFRENRSREFVYLYLPNPDVFREVAANYDSEQEFFKALESTYISDLVDEVRIKVELQNADGSLTFRELSEGEQQLLMVLGLLRFTREDESLFLLDEPDTHLNPLWSVQYLQMLREIVGEDQSSHIIMTSHNPLVLTDLTKEQVQILVRYERHFNDVVETVLRAEKPLEDPKNLDVTAILTNESFGLRAAVGMERLEDLETQRELAGKEELTPEERQKLGEIKDRLEPLYPPLMDEELDEMRPLYNRFFAELLRAERPSPEGELDFTPEQIQQQRELARAIFERLRAEKEQGDA